MMDRVIILLQQKLKIKNKKMQNIDNGFWKKLMLVLLPLFLVGVVNAIMVYGSIQYLSKQVEKNSSGKVSNEVLLQYMQLHKELHEALDKSIDRNDAKIKVLEKRMDDFITKYLSLQTRGSSMNIKQDDLYEFYVCNGVNPLHVR